ncbi:MAG: HEAT repeat domain-containing protein [Nitrospirota bacterium]
MDASFDIKQRFSPEDQAIAGHLGKFVILFGQALLKMGHHQTGGAKAATAKQELFSEWGHLLPKKREVSFLIRNQEGQSRIYIYGILSQIMPLETLFSADMADLFTKKFVDFFHRHYLAGFTLKPGITPEEIDTFIDAMVEPINAANLNQAIFDVTQKLIANQVVHATLVYEKELPVERESLHFMTQIALTRLDKELRTIPLYSHLTDSEKQTMKANVCRGLLIGLLDVTVFRELLIHCPSIVPSGWVPPLDMEIEIAKGVGNPLLWKFLSASAEKQEANPPSTESEPKDRDRLISIVKKIVMNLSLDQMEDHSEAVLESLLEEKVTTLMEIPEPVLEQVYLLRKANDYLKNKTHEALTKWNKETGHPLIPILPVLLKGNLFQPFGELLDHLYQTQQSDLGNEETSHFFNLVGITMMRQPILAKLQDRKIVNRKELFQILEDRKLALLFWASLLPFCSDEDVLLRRNVCRVVACAGETVVSEVLSYGKDPVRNWYALRNVVMILGDIGLATEPVLTFLKRSNRHPNPRVREETLLSFGKIKGPDAEKILIRELENPDKTFLAHVALALGNFDPVHPQTIAFFQETLRKKRKNETEADEHLQIHCCLAIEAISRFNPSIAESFAPMLCDAIILDKPGLFGIVREKHHEKGYAIKKAICQLLGELGTKEAFSLVGRLITDKYWHPEDNAAMHLALQKIERRTALG